MFCHKKMWEKTIWVHYYALKNYLLGLINLCDLMSNLESLTKSLNSFRNATEKNN